MASKTKTKAKSKSKAETGAASKTAKSRFEIVREQIKEALGQIESGYIDLSKLLSEAYHKEFYVKWGFDTFEDYCAEELDVKYRKAMYFVDIWDKVKQLKLNPRTVASLGWTKMKEIATVINEKNAKEWLEKAKSMTSRELTEAVKIVRNKQAADGTVPVVTTMTFRMSEAEANIISEAIEEAKKLTENENPVVALEMICQDWMADKGAQPEKTPLQSMLKYVEAVYGVTVTAKQKKKKKATTKKKKEVLEKVTGKKNGEDSVLEEDLAGEGDEGDADLNEIFALDGE